MKSNQLFKTIQIGIYAALIIVAITYIRIPMPSAISNSFVHPGNALVILAVLLMGLKRGSLAACIGLFLFDALNGYIAVAGFTVLENLIVIAMVYWIYASWMHKQDDLKNIIILGIVGALVKVVVIFVKFVIQQLLLKATWSTALAVAATGMPASLFTACVTAILVPVLYIPMRDIFKRFHTIGE
ncbi:ECF transporter S component [Ignavigranum ruoffiae]|uniref:ECF transporter S component n=1 Tax=Ignavigranum ruoffiae TaxID=89093 RepID=UPI002357D350|nr:ECF transporter S component [Ignavigranum ruoffiae]